VAGLEYIQL